MKIEKIIKTTKPLNITKQVIVNIIYSGNDVSFKLNKALKPYDISLQQFNVLRILRGQKGECISLAGIQERMINTNSNTTRLIDKLIIKKYVKRTTNKANRRKVSICITETGLAFVKELDDVIDNKTEQKIVSNLSKEECLLLNNLLEKIRT